jgi:sigma-E factor negative regulatory protein RseC
MIETGRVKEIQGSSLLIDRESDINCFGCLDKECKARAYSYSAENAAGLDLRPGLLVETETAASPIRQGLGALLPPLLGFVAGYVVTGLAIPAAGEPLRAAAGALLLFAVAGALYLFRRRHPPRIIRRVVRVVGEA